MIATNDTKLTHTVTQEQNYYKDEDGNLHGEYQRFYEDGTMQMVAHYNHGLREGISEEYDEYGILSESYLWENHRIAQVLHEMPLNEAEELIGLKYWYFGR